MIIPLIIGTYLKSFSALSINLVNALINNAVNIKGIAIPME
jgi:hypothetical protein